MKTKLIEIMIQKSPVPVEFNSVLSSPGYYGLHHKKGNKYSGSRAYIEILDDLSDEKKLSVLVHEISHALCEQKNCECQQDKSDVLKEQHAYSYELKWLLKHKLKTILKNSMEHIKNLSEDSIFKYEKATKNIIKTKLWQKCLEYVNKI